jgi:hypothetical protein
MSVEDYCELCDLPKSTCIHGNPPAPPPPPPARAARTKATPVVRKSVSSGSRSGAGSASRTSSSAAAAAPTRRVPRKWTPPEVFAPVIVQVLDDAGGELEQEELFRRLEERVSEQLTDADHGRTPEGELRWRYAARRARQALIAEGQMTKGRPGVWALA